MRPPIPPDVERAQIHGMLLYQQTMKASGAHTSDAAEHACMHACDAAEHACLGGSWSGSGGALGLRRAVQVAPADREGTRRCRRAPLQLLGRAARGLVLPAGRPPSSLLCRAVDRRQPQPIVNYPSTNPYGVNC